MALLAVGCTTQPTASTSPTAGASPSVAFNATDTAWIQLMIPMNERAQLLTDLAPSRTTDPGLTAMAAKTGSRLREDLRRLRTLLQLSGVPDTRPHEGHNMPGMVSLTTIEKAAATTGQTFDTIVTAALRAHLTQSRMLCASERTYGQADKAKELAADIATHTAEQISWLDRLRPAQAVPGGNTAATRP
ncbi:DUF305 domain-containing protein [Streptomyces phaeoluteigriseus]|uniref:DUF305 domain-containing protein n=1 Tax=Streptomyces phaeoluteigriseus TaxID=114686 RepID=A0ABY4ZMM3_9ACTN|nr:DUF305 domain-containing protein [Streptomyces phaeoluteigriseus]USQ89613.1 DUF305 domain-containing protein [Streptomyces phaeoluteigriseus]